MIGSNLKCSRLKTVDHNVLLVDLLLGYSTAPRLHSFHNANPRIPGFSLFLVGLGPANRIQCMQSTKYTADPELRETWSKRLGGLQSFVPRVTRWTDTDLSSAKQAEDPQAEMFAEVASLTSKHLAILMPGLARHVSFFKRHYQLYTRRLRLRMRLVQPASPAVFANAFHTPDLHSAPSHSAPMERFTSLQAGHLFGNQCMLGRIHGGR